MDRYSQTGEIRNWYRFALVCSLFMALALPATGIAAPAAQVVDPAQVDMEAKDTIRITIKDFTYQKGKVVIAPGTTLVWVNQDPVQHDVKLPPVQNDSLDSSVKTVKTKLVGQGKRIALRFNQKGNYLYICSIHPFMKGVVEVKES